jgi:OmpA-OmpF porin, OOP family
MRLAAVLVLVLVPLVVVRASFADTAAPDPRRLAVQADRIALFDPIAFEAGKAAIKPTSLPLLEAVAATLRGNPQLGLVEIGVHSDERGAEAFNARVTAARAAAIKQYLVDHGVAADRLRATGYGETRPLCTEHDEACWSKNRRVELLIVRRTGSP